MELLKKYKFYIASAIALLYILIEAKGEGDFVIFLSASKDLFEGIDIYEKKYVDGYHYFYSVFFAIILYPFTFLPLYITKLIWLCSNLFFIYRIFQITFSYFEFNAFSKKRKNLFYFLVILFPLRFIMDNFHLAQMTIFMLYLCLEGVQLIQNNKTKHGAFLIALGINIKLLPLVLLPYLLWRKQFKAAIYCLAFYGFLLALPALVVGKQHNQFLLRQWWLQINPTQQQHVIDVEERSFHGLSTLLPTLLMDKEKVPDVYALPLKRNIANISEEAMNLTLTICRLLLVLFSLYFLKLKPFQDFANKLKTWWELSYLLLVIPLIFPHQQFYSFLFTLPASSYLLFSLILNYNKPGKFKQNLSIVCLSLIYLCFSLSFILGTFRVYYEHYKIITYGTLLLIPLLSSWKPHAKQTNIILNH